MPWLSAFISVYHGSQPPSFGWRFIYKVNQLRHQPIVTRAALRRGLLRKHLALEPAAVLEQALQDHLLTGGRINPR